jgi:hypothetical protein
MTEQPNDPIPYALNDTDSEIAGMRWAFVLDQETDKDFATLWALDRIVMGLDPCYEAPFDWEREGLFPDPCMFRDCTRDATDLGYCPFHQPEDAP